MYLTPERSYRQYICWTCREWWQGFSAISELKNA